MLLDGRFIVKIAHRDVFAVQPLRPCQLNKRVFLAELMCRTSSSLFWFSAHSPNSNTAPSMSYLHSVFSTLGMFAYTLVSALARDKMCGRAYNFRYRIKDCTK